MMTMVKQYIRVAMVIAPSHLGLQIQQKIPPGSPVALMLASWIARSYRAHIQEEIRWSDMPCISCSLHVKKSTCSFSGCPHIEPLMTHDDAARKEEPPRPEICKHRMKWQGELDGRTC